MIAFDVSGTDRSPQLIFHVNSFLALYHWLRREAENPRAAIDDRFSHAVSLMRRAVNPRGVHGIWDIWEGALASGPNRDRAIDQLQQAIATTGDDLVTALAEAEDVFLAEKWPERLAAIHAAIETVETTLASVFPAMAARHSDLLKMPWPESIDVYLVADCYDRGGAYSHPLTIDVVQNAGLTLCETVLHEATHVADVHCHQNGIQTVADRLIAHFSGNGLDSRSRFNLWHAVIFASSAARIRDDLDAGHIDYAHHRGLYTWFGAPRAAEHWRVFEEEGRDEKRLANSLLAGRRHP